MSPHPSIAHRRLAHQHLVDSPFNTPTEVVGWLGAVQAQDYLGAKWSLGLRMSPTTDAAIEEAFNAGHLLRTHMMRPTWHFVLPADLRWMMHLTAPRVKAVNAYMERKLELDEATLAHSHTVLGAALQGGNYLTRDQLGAALAEAGIHAQGPRLAYIVMRAELDLVVCSGPRQGKQFSYALVDERAPAGPTLPYDEALARLTERYLTGHGPATVQDLAWWSGLTLTEAKAGVALLDGRVQSMTLDDETYYITETTPPPPDTHQRAHLLPTYDEYLIAFAAFGRARGAGLTAGQSPTFESMLILGGQVIGSWKRILKQRVVEVQVALLDPMDAAQRATIEAAVQRYGRFMDLPTHLTVRETP